jgi:hypothetical protein
MSKKEEKMITFEEAKQEVEIASRRIALLHLAYAKTLIEEFGEKKGKKLVARAIKKYGILTGEKTRQEVLDQGLKPTPENFNAGKSLRIPKFGMHERVETLKVNGEQRRRVYGCALAKLWKEYGEEKIGRLYCYVDPAKYMAYNPNFKLVHIRAASEGHECCEFAVRPTTEEERKDFSAENKDWFYIDK